MPKKLKKIFLIKINTDKAYLIGLLVGGGVIHGDSLQIILPYKKWGELAINPVRAGGIAEDILARLNPLWCAHYNMSTSYRIGTDWKILSNKITDSLKKDIIDFGLPSQGELRYTANLIKIYPFLRSNEHKESFVTGLADTIGSLAVSHRRFVSDFQVISFEFKGNNFKLVTDVARILIDIGCHPDQILWNHPNQHSGLCRYYKNWKKGFKIRVALDDYMLKGGFVFKSKQLSARDNKFLQKSGENTTEGKLIKISGRVTLHKDECSDWLPSDIRGIHFIHNLHFYKVFGLSVPKEFEIEKYLINFQDYFCSFTCLTKGSLSEIQNIIESERYLSETKYSDFKLNIADILSKYYEEPKQLMYGKTKNDGFPINFLLQGVSYIIAASTGDSIKGKRVIGNYISLIEKYQEFSINICIPDKGTCVLLKNSKYAALVGYVNSEFNRTLIRKEEGLKFYVREPNFDECVLL